MTRKYDLTIIGSGPAGMSAAIRASGLGLNVLVVDEQPAP
ncbi:MAG TPA: FAD-binding protein, partial [Burkholderiaceae bacterium]|nr:FAD-binding protein [Burkholderiaceae bacterium]